MKISKHIHSCLLINDQGKDILIDPGNYSIEENVLSVSEISKLDYLLITHEHADHMHIPLVKEIVGKFPSVQILTNKSASEILAKEGIKTVDSISEIEAIEIPHEKVFGGNPPQNIQFNIFNKLSDPGDSLHFEKINEVLALPIQAPWCSLTESVEKAISLKPKVIIPIHDWHWNEKARSAFYERLKKYFEQFEIDFKPMATGDEVVV